MQWLLSGTLVLFAVGCAGQDRAATDSDPSTATPATVVATPTPVPTPAASSFRGASWRVGSLVIDDQADTDGDGVVDNKLVEVLASLSVLMGADQVSLELVNANIEANLAADVTVVFLDARSDGDLLEIDVLPGTSALVVDTTLAYDEQGQARAQVTGAMWDETGFEAAGQIMVPVTMIVGYPPAPIRFEQVTMDGSLTVGALDGQVRGAIPIQAFIDEVVAPMIAPGDTFTLDLVNALAPGFADVALPGGVLAVSASFQLSADAWTL